MSDPPGAAKEPHQSSAHFEYAVRYPVQMVAFLFRLVNGGVLMRAFGSGSWALLVAALVGRPVGILLAIAPAVAAGLQLSRRSDGVTSSSAFAVSSAGETLRGGPPTARGRRSQAVLRMNAQT